MKVSAQFFDEVRGQVEFEWAREQDHVIQRADGTCLYHLASVVDDYEMKITHVVRAVEHLSNTPRQIFIAQSLGYELPVYAHLPFVAEPGGTAKMSKRNIGKYLKQRDFAALTELGNSIAAKTGQLTQQATFNPVIVEFYQSIGFLPAGILNYLLLLGWSLDDSTEDFSIQEMTRKFSLQRVTKSPASFDPQKLLAFQSRWMHRLTLEEKTAMCLPFLQAAGLLGDEIDAESRQRLQQVVAAADDRLKIAGDILDYDDFFVDAEELTYDPKAFEKRLRADADAAQYLRKFRQQLQSLDTFDAASTEACLKQFVEAEDIKINQIIHALRVALTGKAVGFGMFDILAILGKDQVLTRIDRALDKMSLAD